MIIHCDLFHEVIMLQDTAIGIIGLSLTHVSGVFYLLTGVPKSQENVMFDVSRRMPNITLTSQDQNNKCNLVCDA